MGDLYLQPTDCVYYPLVHPTTINGKECKMLARSITNAGSTKLIGKFPSLKMGRIVWYESLLERDYLYLLEIDPRVISYQEQPLRIYYFLEGKKRRYTPDLLIQRKHGKHIVEVKPKKKAMEQRYVTLFRIADEICRREGYGFHIATDAVIRSQPRLNVAKFLYKYARTPLFPQHQIYCHELFARRQEILLGELINFFAARAISQQVVFALIFHGVLSINLMETLTPSSIVRLPIQGHTTGKES